MALLFVLFILAVYVGLSFFISAGIIWLIAWAFDLIFSWKAVIGVWLILVLVSSFFKSDSKTDK